MYNIFHDKNEIFDTKKLNILGIDLGDRPELVRKFINENQIPWDIAILHKGFQSKFVKKLYIYQIPSYLLIAPDGRIAASDDQLGGNISHVIEIILSGEY